MIEDVGESRNDCETWMSGRGKGVSAAVERSRGRGKREQERTDGRGSPSFDPWVLLVRQSFSTVLHRRVDS